MRITDLLDVKSICLDAAPASKEEALNQAVDLMLKSGKIKDAKKYKEAVYAREAEGTTGIGEGIAIPHGRGDSVAKPGLAAMVIKNGVDFEALDDEPVHLLFLIAAPDTKDNVHLDVLSKLSNLTSALFTSISRSCNKLVFSLYKEFSFLILNSKSSNSLLNLTLLLFKISNLDSIFCFSSIAS